MSQKMTVYSSDDSLGSEDLSFETEELDDSSKISKKALIKGNNNSRNVIDLRLKKYFKNLKENKPSNSFIFKSKYNFHFGTNKVQETHSLWRTFYEKYICYFFKKIPTLNEFDYRINKILGNKGVDEFSKKLTLGKEKVQPSTNIKYFFEKYNKLERRKNCPMKPTGIQKKQSDIKYLRVISNFKLKRNVSNSIKNPFEYVTTQQSTAVNTVKGRNNTSSQYFLMTDNRTHDRKKNNPNNISNLSNIIHQTPNFLEGLKDISKAVVLSENENFITLVNQQQNLTLKEKEILFNIYNKKYCFSTEFDNYNTSSIFKGKNIRKHRHLLHLNSNILLHKNKDFLSKYGKNKEVVNRNKKVNGFLEEILEINDKVKGQRIKSKSSVNK